MHEVYFSDTQTVIQDTLLELLDARELGTISVTDIVKAAHVNRSTFYYHFRDKDAIVDSIVERAMAFMGLGQMPSDANRGSLRTWLDECTQLVKENSRFFHLLVTSGIYQKTVNVCQDRLMDMVRGISPTEVPEGCSPNFLLQCRARIVSSVIEVWARENCESPREEVLRVMWSFLDPNEGLRCLNEGLPL